jgi:hypothetical protein
MSTDLVLRTLGTLACIYTVGLFVSLMSVAALNGASFTAGVPCDRVGCHVAYEQNLEPSEEPAEHRLIQAAASILAAE